VMDESLASFTILLVVDFESDNGWVGGSLACFFPSEVAGGREECDVSESELLGACGLFAIGNCVFANT